MLRPSIRLTRKEPERVPSGWLKAGEGLDGFEIVSIKLGGLLLPYPSRGSFGSHPAPAPTALGASLNPSPIVTDRSPQ